MLACREVIFEFNTARIARFDFSYSVLWRELLEAASDLEIVSALVVPQLYNGMRKSSHRRCPLRQFPGAPVAGGKI